MTVRQQLAGGFLIALLTVPAISTMAYSSPITDALCMALMLAFNLLMLPDAARPMYAARHDRLVRIGVLVALLCMFMWHYFQGPFLDNLRFWFYIVLAVFFFAISAWFRVLGEDALERIFIAKIGVLLLTLAIIGAAMIEVPAGHSLFSDMPIYRNLRHLNYDLTLVIGLGIYFWAATNSFLVRAAYLVAFVAMGYFSAWSGGRGEMLALIVMVGSLIAAGWWCERRLWCPLVALSLGALLVPTLGEAQQLYGQIGRFTSISAEQVSSGRISIWVAAWQRVIETPASLFFGYAPDAFLQLRITGEAAMHSVQLAQPHNVLIQWLLEFGFLGTSVLVGLYGRVALRALKVLRSERHFSPSAIVAALLFGIFAFAMVDGLFYRPIPLSFIVMLCAYLVVARPDSEQVAE